MLKIGFDPKNNPKSETAQWSLWTTNTAGLSEMWRKANLSKNYSSDALLIVVSHQRLLVFALKWYIVDYIKNFFTKSSDNLFFCFKFAGENKIIDIKKNIETNQSIDTKMARISIILRHFVSISRVYFSLKF